jgi:hypothetical protein
MLNQLPVKLIEAIPISMFCMYTLISTFQLNVTCYGHNKTTLACFTSWCSQRLENFL